MTIPKNLKPLIRKNLQINGTILGLFIGVCIIMGHPLLILSALLGSVSSYILFYQLISAQVHILATQKKNAFFPAYLFRLMLCAIPIGVALKFSAYLNLWVVLVFLFSFQLIHIVMELIISFYHYRKRMNRGRNR